MITAVKEGIEMALNLSDFFQLHSSTNTMTTQGNGNVTIAADSLNLINSSMAAKLLSLLPGQTVQGEVVGVQGNQVQLLLGEGMLLNAFLDNQIGINAGQLMSFQIKSNTGSLLSLIPLSVNLTTDENVMKALNEAGLPVTEKTVEMVNALMKEGMPIDKDTLLTINKELQTYPKADVETIVQMERLKIPVTLENIEQFEAYKNNQHKIAEGITDIQKQLTALMTGKGGQAQTAEFLGKLLDFFAGKEAGAEGVVLKPSKQAVLPETTGELKTAETVNDKQAGKEAAGTEALMQGEKGEKTEGARQTEGTVQTQTSQETVTTAAETESSKVLTPSEKQEFIMLLKELGVEDGKTALLEKGQIDVKQLTALLQTENFTPDKLKQLFASKEFVKLLGNELTNQLLVKPEQMSRENMEEYYTNLRNQTEKLVHILESTGRGDTTAAKSLQNINRNVDFLNQLNQLFTYVQIPLKMAGNAAHGELYVYTNKKNLTKKDGNVSALLHLDMPHLGTVDVYVAMQERRVSTKFYLQEESVIDFLEGHMSLLTKRLEQKGYQTSAEILLREKTDKKTVMEEILKQDKNVPEMNLIGTRAFDVRA